MAQQLTTSFVTTNVPGAYANVTVVSNPSGLPTTGVVTIIGEADGGPSYLEDTLKNNFFTPAQADLVRAKYLSGNILDAMNALCAPSADANIQGAPTQIYIIKTNTGFQASANVGPYVFTVTSANANAGAVYTNNGQSFTVISNIVAGTTLVASGTGLPTTSGVLTKVSGLGDSTITFSADTDYGTITDANYGLNGNNIKYQITASVLEAPPFVNSNTIPAFLLTDSLPQIQTIATGTAASVTTIAAGQFLTLQAGNAGAFYYIWFKVDGVGVDPAPPGMTGLLVSILSTDINSAVATKIAAAINLAPFNTQFTAVVSPSNTVTITNVVFGDAAAISNATAAPVSGVTLAVVQYGESHDDTLLNGASFSLRLNGGAVSTVTLSNNEYDHDSVAELVIELNRYTFTTSAATTSIGTTYTTNGQTFTVIAGITTGTTLLMTGTGAPLASGTLTKVGSGAGDASITFSAFSRLLPVGMTASAGLAPNTIILSMDADPANYGKGYGKAFELIDSTPGDLAQFGLVPNLYVSETESEVELNVVNQNQNVNEILTASGAIGFSIGYDGTVATMTINATNLTTTVTGGSGANLNILLSQYSTISDLAAFINTQTGYSASATTVGTQSSPSTLDQVTNIGIATSTTTDEPGRVKQALYRFVTAAGTSGLTTFTAHAVAGLPAPMVGFVFLAGGAKGGTANADVLDGLVDAQSIQTNFLVPLFSQDASLDIPLGLTDSTSTYTIAAINALVKTQELAMSTPLMKHYRQATCSYFGTYANAKTQAQSLATYRCSLAFQQASQTDSEGNVTLFQPWYSACIAAGMQAAGFYKGITNKYGNIISFVDPVDFDSSNPGDLEDALLAGLLILQQDNAGNKWISDQTTYGFDNNFVYNSMQAVYLSDVATLGLINGVQTNFIGQSVADITAGDVKTYVQSLMSQYKQLKIISASDDAPLGYKNLQVSIVGPVINISIELKLSTTIYFAAINISISQVEQTAS